MLGVNLIFKAEHLQSRTSKNNKIKRWFHGMKVPIQKVIWIIHEWSTHTPLTVAAKKTGVSAQAINCSALSVPERCVLMETDEH